eukprot:jgi/Botrbrau1/22725/Bobra.0132s0064.1
MFLTLAFQYKYQEDFLTNTMSRIAESLMSDIDTWKKSLDVGLRLHASNTEARLDYLLEQTKNVEIIVLSQLKDSLFDLNESQYWDFASKEILEAKRSQVLVLCEEELSKVKREFSARFGQAARGI